MAILLYTETTIFSFQCKVRPYGTRPHWTQTLLEHGFETGLKIFKVQGFTSFFEGSKVAKQYTVFHKKKNSFNVNFVMPI